MLKMNASVRVRARESACVCASMYVCAHECTCAYECVCVLYWRTFYLHLVAFVVNFCVCVHVSRALFKCVCGPSAGPTNTETPEQELNSSCKFSWPKIIRLNIRLHFGFFLNRFGWIIGTTLVHNNLGNVE